MRKIIAAGLAALTFLGAATAAQADSRYRRHRDRDNGAAVAAGIAGLAIGAALASGSRDRGYYNNGYYDRGYGRGYYDRGYGRGYYGRGYYAPRGYYDRGYYAAPRRYRYARECRVYQTWDPYYGGYIRRERCW